MKRFMKFKKCSEFIISTFFICGILLLFILSCAGDEIVLNSVDNTPFSERFNNIVNFLIYNDENNVGMSAAIILSDGTEYTSVAGFSEPGLPITEDMYFDMGSAGKNLFATLIMAMVEDGELSLDDRYDKYIDPLPNANMTATLRQGLNHTSGMYMAVEHPANPLRKPFLSIDFEKIWTLEEIFSMFMEEPYFAPGEDWHYSQAGYQMGTRIVEQLTGNSTATEIGNRLMIPNGFNEFLLDYNEPVPPEYKIAHSWYDYDNDGLYNDISGRSRNYIKSLSTIYYYATPRGYARWLHALFNGEVVSQESLEEMLQFHTPTPGEPILSGYGLGTYQMIYNGLELWGHSGSMFGYRTLGLYSPEYDITFVVMINSDYDDSLNNILSEVVLLIRSTQD